MSGEDEAELNRKESIRMKQYMLDKAGERENAHRKAFTKWVNSKLADHPTEPCTIKDVVTDLQDGRMLLNLLEVLTRKKLKKEKGNLRVHKINNVERALVLLDECKIKLVGINGFDIVDGKHRVILGLLWSIILRFQVEEVMQQEVNAESAKSFTIEKRLLEWCRERLDGYDVEINDFSSSWQNGLAFSAILHSYNPEAFDYTEVKQMDTTERLEHAFQSAEDGFDVPRILDASDVNVPRPDKKLIILYLSSMYDKLEAAREKNDSQVHEEEVVVKVDEEVESALQDSWDELDARPHRSREERDKANNKLTRKLDDLEAAIDDAEYRRPVTKDSDLLELPSCNAHLNRHKKYVVTLDSLNKCAKEVMDEGKVVINDGYIDEDRENYFVQRMKDTEERVQTLHTEGYANKEKVATVYMILLKQQLRRMNEWVSSTERKIAQDVPPIGHDYDTIKEQADEHQKLHTDIANHSMLNIMSEVDTSDPALDQETRTQLKSAANRYTALWDWSEARKARLGDALGDWKKFRDEELLLLNWLAQKEKVLKEISNTDLMDCEEVKNSEKTLQDIEEELSAQEERLEALHRYGEELMQKAADDDATVHEIETQLKDFDECWNDVAKQVIDHKEKLSSAGKRIAEMRAHMKEVNDWMDDANNMLTDIAADPDQDEYNRLKDKLELKCDERGAVEKKVSGVERLSSDIQPLLDTSSAQILEEETDAFKDKWSATNSALESFSDKGYSDKKSECCLVRIIRRKFKSTNN